MEITVPGYHFVNFLKSGAQACVVQAKKNGVDYAVRIIEDLDKPIIAARATRELLLLQNCDHENIIEILDVPSNAQKLNLENLFITVPLMDFTFEEFARIDLWRKEKENFHIRLFMVQLLRGVDYLHRNNILHRDLSARNVMINRKLVVKIIDFGLARENQDLLTMAPFTLPYQAPERVLKFKCYDSKIDLWSVGCLFAELITGNRMFLTCPTDFPEIHLLRQSFAIEQKVPESFHLQMKQTFTDKEIMHICDEDYRPLEKCFTFPPPNFIEDDKDIHSAKNGFTVLNHLLRLNPEECWSAEQALTHPFFGDNAPRNQTLKNPKECQLVFDQINFALKNEDINQLTDLLQKQISQAPRL